MNPRQSKRVILPVMTGVLLLLPYSAAAAPGFGDYTGNGYVDLDDYFWLPGCMTGPTDGPPLRGCEVFDSGSDGDVDLLDFHAFQRVFASCVAPEGTITELFCDARYRDILSNLTPLLQPAICAALEAVGQAERCPEPHDDFYVEMTFLTADKGRGIPTLNVELLDGGSSIGIRVPPQLQEMEVFVDGVSTAVVPVSLSLGFRTASLMDVLTVIQKGREHTCGLVTANIPCYLWHLPDLLAEVYTDEYIFAIFACTEFKSCAALLLIDDERFEELLGMFSTLGCTDIVIRIEDYFTMSQRSGVASTLYEARDWVCEYVCPCTRR